ncbi:phage replisome organizer N-terminal domain-containing protein [Lachnobacterium bovis]|uniref:phage replisome organizer N-terminal domain-containing protein n=1 Tax=Lachnobacterium bovis TaxID=140626 RepID=UPI000687249C|nr:phage replisome organizer N-terminal domain-containing protein [Lachnobacterium bovis]
MAERKKYYWLQLKRDFFKRHDIQIIESMPNGKDYILFYLKLLCESVNHEGNLRFSDQIPYNEQMLSTITNTNVDVVRSAIKIFSELGMMEVMDDGTYFMREVQKMIGTAKQDEKTRESTRLRVQAYRERKKQGLLEENRYSNVTCNGEIEKDIEKDIDTDKDTDKEIERDTESNHNRLLAESRNQTESDNPLINTPKQIRTNYQEIVDLFHQTCKSYPVLKSLTESRKKAIKARLNKYSIDDIQTVFNKAEASDFMKGSNNRNWMANFDWMLKESNFVKILEGKYDNWEAKEKNTVFSKNKSTQDMSKEEYLKLWENI